MTTSDRTRWHAADQARNVEADFIPVYSLHVQSDPVAAMLVHLLAGTAGRRRCTLRPSS